MSRINREMFQGQGLAWYIFECIMSILYLLLSGTFLFTDAVANIISDGTLRRLIGILLGVYGLFRVYRALRKLFLKS